MGTLPPPGALRQDTRSGTIFKSWNISSIESRESAPRSSPAISSLNVGMGNSIAQAFWDLCFLVRPFLGSASIKMPSFFQVPVQSAYALSKSKMAKSFLDEFFLYVDSALSAVRIWLAPKALLNSKGQFCRGNNLDQAASKISWSLSPSTNTTAGFVVADITKGTLSAFATRAYPVVG